MIRTSKTTIRPHSPSRFLLALVAMGSLVNLLPSASAQAATKEVIIGEIDFITVTNPGDHWSGGTIVVGGQTVIIPRNLLLDLPANRMTLAQFIQEDTSAQLYMKQAVERFLVDIRDKIKWG